jgi:hypothetical protein
VGLPDTEFGGSVHHREETRYTKRQEHNSAEVFPFGVRQAGIKQTIAVLLAHTVDSVNICHNVSVKSFDQLRNHLRTNIK